MGLWDGSAFSIVDSAVDSPASGGFTLRRDEANDLVKRLEGIRQQLREMHEDVVSLCRITPPSQDPATTAYQHALTADAEGQPAALSYGGGHIDLQISYVTELINRITTALDTIQASDETQTGLIKSAGQESGGRV